MAGTIVEWLTFFLFVFLFVGAVIVEVRWLVSKGWATTSRAVGFVLTTDLVGFCIGGIVALVAFFGMFMMVMGPAGTGSNAPEAAYWAVSALAVIVPLFLFFVLKRLFLLIFKIGSGRSVWLYSLLSTILILFFVLVPPPLILYLIGTLWKS